MIIPGTYITVRSEGLISAGRIATGVVGVVGTAASGPVNVPVTLAGLSNAREIFGPPDSFQQPADGSHPLTLMRALELVYGNGASSVMAVRAAGSTSASASFALQDAQGRTVATLTAATPGTWANELAVRVAPSDEDCPIADEPVDPPFTRLRYTRVVPSAQNRIRITRGATRRVENLIIIYGRVLTGIQVPADAQNRFFLPERRIENVAGVNEIRILASDGALVRRHGDGAILYGAGGPPAAGEVRITPEGELLFEAGEVPGAGQRVVATVAVGHDDPTNRQVLVRTWDGSLQFAAGQAPDPASGDTLTASYLVDRASCVRVTLALGTTTVERFVTPDGRVLAQLVSARSRLATAAADGANGHRTPAPVESFFGTGSNTPGDSGADAGADDHARGLEQLANRIVNIVVLAGQDAARMGDTLLAHLNSTEDTDHERIGVIGAPGNDAAGFQGHSLASERLVLAAPGLRLRDGTTLPTGYAAAAVAGAISSLPVQGSLTNKTVNIPGLAVNLNRGEQEQLIRRNVLAVVDKEGFRIVKGVTTAGEGTPFSAIPTRRIVDFAKYGVRSAANSYLGRLNNERVRAALKATLDAFLTRMVQDEALTGYELEVNATRAQEIAGEVSVAMTLQPTFSIEYIRVTMILR
jgi:hypothetical protein